MEERAIAVASPDIAFGDMTASLKDVVDLPLLHLETRPDAWRAWLSNQGVIHDNLSGVQFDQFASMIQAAIFGLGAAIVPEYLVQSELRSGKLVVLGTQKASVLGSYYLVWPERGENYPALVQFKEWIAKVVQPQTTI
jgi:LysR family glycine cleavage system transcriptional activator